MFHSSLQLFFGFVSDHCRSGMAVALIEKRALVGTAAPRTERRKINLMDRHHFNCVEMNSTSLVSIQDQSFVLKKDFWNSAKNSP